jgi:hypothetical protein
MVTSRRGAGSAHPTHPMSKEATQTLLNIKAHGDLRGKQNMFKKLALGVSTLALAVGGLAVTAGPAFAKKPQLDGTLTCNTSSTTTFKPSLVLAIPNKREAQTIVKPGKNGKPDKIKYKPAKPGKDKKAKIVTHTVLSGCHGSETGGAVPPTAGTTDTKTKALSRLCQNQGNVPPGKTKTSLTGGSGGKFKETGGTTTTFLDSGTPNDHSDDIPLPTSTADLLAALGGPHGTDQLYILGTGGVSTGKAYLGKSLSSVSHSPGILAKFNACASAAGLGSINTTGTTSIG